MDRPFITGLDLSEALYREAVGPILARHFPGLTHSAALIGPGSEVLGFDTEQSTDHNWGPRLLVFLAKDDLTACGERLDQALRTELPTEIRGYSTHFAEEGDTRWMVPLERGPVNHGVQLVTVSGYFTAILGFDPAGDIRPLHWVSVPQQSGA